MVPGKHFLRCERMTAAKHLNNFTMEVFHQMGKWISTWLLMGFMLAAVLASANKVQAYTLFPEGKTTLCSITEDLPKEEGLYTVRYTLKPSKNGTYTIFSFGADSVNSEIRDKNGNYISGDTGEDVCYDAEDLKAGEEYTLEFSYWTFKSFYVGMFQAGSGQTVIQTANYTVTDQNNGQLFEAISDRNIKNAVWQSSNDAVVHVNDWDQMSGNSRIGTNLLAKKNGTAIIRLVDSVTGEVYASCNVTCRDITEQYDVFVGDIQVTNKNASGITGSGISGKVTYDRASNTLTLNNAVLEKAGYMSSDNYGRSSPAAISYSGRDTIKIRLVGSNTIRKLDYKPRSTYDSSVSYAGTTGIVSLGSVSFVGTGSLTIDSANTGVGISCADDLSIADGSTVTIRETFANNSNGIDAGDSVSVAGSLTVTGQTYTLVVDGKRGGIRGYGITARKLYVSSTGKVNITEETANEVTSYCILLTDGGSANVQGYLSATASGAKGQSAGVAVGAAEKNTPFKISGSGNVILKGNLQALDKIRLSTDRSTVTNAGSSPSRAYTVTPSGGMTDRYITAGKSVKSRIKPVTVKKPKAAKKAFTAKWKVLPGRYVNGYQIRYSLKANFKKAKTVTLKKASASSKKITKLKANKKYYISIRSYKTVNGKKRYSTWSKKKTVKTK